MERKLQFYKSGDNMVITYEEELRGFHKEAISVDEKRYKEIATKVAQQVRGVKGFVRFSLGFGQIDWYDNCNEYEVPYFTCNNENKRIKAGYNYYNEIPKDWTKNFTLVIENPTSIRGINKFIEALGLNISDSQKAPIFKCIKEDKGGHIEL